MDEQVILVCGDAVNGLTFVGPFANAEDAGYYAEDSQSIRSDTWVIAVLEAPEQTAIT